MTVATELKRLMAERSITGYRLAPILGTHPGHVHRWTTGNREPSLHNLARIAAALNLSNDEIATLVRAAHTSQETHP